MGPAGHQGKVYRTSETEKADLKTMEQLRKELTDAIEKEEFERAAIIRDAIHSLSSLSAKKV